MTSVRQLDTSPSRWSGLAPMGMLALIGSAGMFSANIMPVLISALREGLGYPARDAGLIGAADVYGAAIGCALAALLLKRLPWRLSAAAMLAVLVTIDVVSPQCRAFALLLPLRFVHGLVGGVSVGIGFSVIGRTPVPDRGFGVLMCVQFCLAGLSLMVLPSLIARYGAGVPFIALALLGLLALLVVPLVPDYAGGSAAAAALPSGSRLSAPLLLSLGGLFLFQLTKMSFYSYLFGYGHALGLSTSFLSTVIGASAWLAGLGSLAVVALGLRYGRARLLVGMVLLAVAAYLALLFGGGIAAVFAAAEIGAVMVWAFVAPYLFGMCAAFDAKGQMAAWSSFFSKLGMASGPALGGLLLAETHYERLLWLAIAGIVASGCCLVWPAVLLDRQSGR